ncbi:hypothetical protein SISSUDRAFT_1031038 [Sistotremastrum suecicum HHB10207 ss-3]|uniref:Oxidase ustYa n=1 Tax=Sistotremastrum suecicum HHB10207 ss-3 TaxID=1314776 RepID=A0A166GI80_9AGAM|nr:hypothetical protein SISSUDRAFT_1031038 [Sistotremastrum suecicum HHB10207 ss-3]
MNERARNLYIAAALALVLNVVAVFHNLRLISASQNMESPRIYSYQGDDYPQELPIEITTVALKFDDTPHYRLNTSESMGEYMSMIGPYKGFFRPVIPNDDPNDKAIRVSERLFGISMFHQLHCLDKIRSVLVSGSNPRHAQHCMNYLRQSVLCRADTMLDPEFKDGVAGGVGAVHVCRDWSAVYAYAQDNWELWGRKKHNAVV